MLLRKRSDKHDFGDEYFAFNLANRGNIVVIQVVHLSFLENTKTIVIHVDELSEVLQHSRTGCCSLYTPKHCLQAFSLPINDVIQLERDRLCF